MIYIDDVIYAYHRIYDGLYGDEHMPHSVREENLENICASCKQPHGNKVVLKNFNQKIYEIITCQNCGYEIIRLKPEKEFHNKLDVFHKV